MTPLRYVVRSIARYRGMHAAVGLGIIAATAVLTGALLVGDSMRGSLRTLALDGLGRIDGAVMPGRFFRQALAEEAARRDPFSRNHVAVAPGILLPGTILDDDVQPPRIATGVQLLGCDRRFWAMAGPTADAAPPLDGPIEPGQVVLNEPLAERLGISQPGEEVLLRVPLEGAIPAESALGRNEGTIGRGRLTVKAIVPARGLGRFTLRPTQQLPLCAFVSLEWLQELIDARQKVNTLLLGDGSADAALPLEVRRQLQAAIRPTLEDYGLRVETLPDEWRQIVSDRLIVDDATSARIEAILGSNRVETVSTYLANNMVLADRHVPYSTVAAIGFPPGERLVDLQGKPIATIGDDEIVLNAWAADDLGAEPGDTIRLTYYEPEDVEGQESEATVALRVRAIAAMQGLGLDPKLTPEVEGFTDQESIDAWDLSFDVDLERLRDKDEDYWDAHRAAPKAIVSLATGRRLWGSRFGSVTSLRVEPADGLDARGLTAAIEQGLDPAALGFAIEPLKRRALESSAGATPFGVLFLAFSFFLIVAALLLVALLFRLAIQLRAPEIGTLLAIGFRRRGVARLLLAEGLAVAAACGLLGVLAGIGYAQLMLVGLTTLWVDAIGTPFLSLHVGPWSLIAGLLGGLLTTGLVIMMSVRWVQRQPVRGLLAGQASSGGGAWFDRRSRPPGLLAWAATLGTLALAAGLGLAATTWGEAAQAGAFFGAGALVLLWLLLILWRAMRRGRTLPATTGGLVRLAAQNAARHPGRSTLSIGLVATACFLIIAVSAFRFDPTIGTPAKDGPTGGYSLIAESDLPIYFSLDTLEGRFELGFAQDEEAAFDDVEVHALRVLAGDDASCLNLYRPRQPRVLGVPDTMIERGGFRWSATLARSENEKTNPWRLLQRDLPPSEDGVPQIPVVLGKETANYSLQIYNLGSTLEITDPGGRPLKLQVVGMLSGVLFQGQILTSEHHLLEHFPAIGGYRAFLIETPVTAAKSSGSTTAAAADDAWQAQRDRVRQILNKRLGDFGFHAESTGERLARYLVVQNTYLLTFQSLGGLGLLLGTFGLAAVQLRNILERRGELAVLRAVGFTRGRLARLVLVENGVLLLGGLGVGALAAAVAVAPHLLDARATIPWPSLGGTLAAVVVVGLLSGMLAVRDVLRLPVAVALRASR